VRGVGASVAPPPSRAPSSAPRFTGAGGGGGAASTVSSASARTRAHAPAHAHTRAPDTRARQLERLAQLVSAHAPALCALLGCLICLWLRLSGRLGGPATPPQHPPATVSQLQAVHAFAANSRAALREAALGGRDSLVAVALAPGGLLRALFTGRPRASSQQQSYQQTHQAYQQAGQPPLPATEEQALSPGEQRARRSAAFAAASCGTPRADAAACSALLDRAPSYAATQPPSPGSLRQQVDARRGGGGGVGVGGASGQGGAGGSHLSVADLDRQQRAAAWRAARCGGEGADGAACAALLTLGNAAAARAASAGLGALVVPQPSPTWTTSTTSHAMRAPPPPPPPPPGELTKPAPVSDAAGACALALAASEQRTGELVAAQLRLEGALEELSLSRRACLAASSQPAHDARACASSAQATEDAAHSETARLEALTVRAEGAAQRAYTLCMGAAQRTSASAAKAAGLVDWLADEADTLLAHAAVLEEQRAAVAARAAASGLGTVERAGWAELATELEGDARQTAAQARDARDESEAAAAAPGALGLPPGQAQPQSVSVPYAVAALAGPLTVLALLSARAAEALRWRLAERRGRLAEEGPPDGPASHTHAWVTLQGEPRVGARLTAHVRQDEALEFEFVWSRVYRGLFQVIHDAHAPWYTLTKEDLGGRVAVTVTAIVAGGEYGPTASARSRTVREW